MSSIYLLPYGSSRQREGSSRQREGSSRQREGSSRQREGSSKSASRLKAVVVVAVAGSTPPPHLELKALVVADILIALAHHLKVVAGSQGLRRGGVRSGLGSGEGGWRRRPYGQMSACCVCGGLEGEARCTNAHACQVY